MAKGKNWVIKTEAANDTFNEIQKILCGMFGKVKIGKKEKMKVIYPFAGGMFSDDCRLTEYYIGMEKKNNTEMYIRLFPCDVNILVAGCGGFPFKAKWESYMSDIERLIDHLVKEGINENEKGGN